MTADLKKLEALAAGFDGRRVLVVGDLMLDRFVYGTVSRISPEAPVPVVRVTHEKDMPGGAGNVAANICSLGGTGIVAGVVGTDKAAHDLRLAFEKSGVSCDAIYEAPSAQTSVKARVVAERQQVVRVDREKPIELSEKEFHKFSTLLADEIGKADAVIIEDYGKGSVSQETVDFVLHAAKKRGIPVGYDPKDDHPLNVRGITLASPNRKEAFAVAGVPESEPADDPLQDEALLKVGRLLQEEWALPVLLITLGPHGMLVLEEGKAPAHIPTRVREVFDVSGAGDTVIGTCMLALAAGASGFEAAELANFAAGVVVGKLGTARCSREELVGYMNSFAGADHE